MTDFSAVEQRLRERGYQVQCFPTAQAAADYLVQQLTGAASVGMGGSVTLHQLGLYDRLTPHTQVFWHQRDEDGAAARQAAMTAQVYLCSVNALARTGEIVNIDGTGNRTAATMYGHKKVIFAVGRNKLTDSAEAALHRARNVAGPKNARRLGKKTPCALQAERCYDCRSPERICRGLTVLWSPMTGMEAEVVLIDEDLGL